MHTLIGLELGGAPGSGNPRKVGKTCRALWTLHIIYWVRREETQELLLFWFLGSQKFFFGLFESYPVGLKKPNFSDDEFVVRARKSDTSLLNQQQVMRAMIFYILD